MPPECKGLICVELEVTKKGNFGISPYLIGKWCRNCQRYIRFSGIKCPCCGATLRTKSRLREARLNRLEFVKRF